MHRNTVNYLKAKIKENNVISLIVLVSRLNSFIENNNKAKARMKIILDKA